MTELRKPTIFLAGHCSRNREGNDEIEKFAAVWRDKHPEWLIKVCFIEYAGVLLNDGLDCAAKNAERVVLLPFILNVVGYVKMELPAALEQARTPPTGRISGDPPFWHRPRTVCSPAKTARRPNEVAQRS